MSVLAPEFVKRLHGVWLAWRRVAGEIAAGPRPLLPAGTADRVVTRDYSPGDDYRLVDWRYCARHDELLTRESRGQVDGRLHVLVDCSCAMALGRPSKWDAACRAAAALAYCGLAELERVTVLAFAGRVVAQQTPGRGKVQIAKVLAMLQALAPQGVAADAAAAAEALVRRRQRPGPTVVISGSHDLAGLCRGLEILRYHGYGPRLLRVYDLDEAAPRMLGDVELLDVETGQARQVTVTEADLDRYCRLYEEFCRRLRRFCASRAIPYVQAAASLPERELLRAAVGLRGEDADIPAQRGSP